MSEFEKRFPRIKRHKGVLDFQIAVHEHELKREGWLEFAKFIESEMATNISWNGLKKIIRNEVKELENEKTT